MKKRAADYIALVLILTACFIQVWNLWISPLPDRLVWGLATVLETGAILSGYICRRRKITYKIEYATILVLFVSFALGVYQLLRP